MKRTKQLKQAQQLQNRAGMKKFSLSTFQSITLTVALAVVASIYTIWPSDSLRDPSSGEKTYELHIQKIKIPKASRISPREELFLRVTFDNVQGFDVGKGSLWNIPADGTQDVDQKIEIDSAWLKNDELQFKVELFENFKVVADSKVELPVLRCATVSKEVSTFNRSYQCFVPGESVAVLTYRLSEKGVPPPGLQDQSQTPVASAY